MFSSVTWKLYSRTEIAVVFLKTNILFNLEKKECGDLCMCVNPVTTCHPCYFWLVTGMTVTGMTKIMQTRIYSAFWKQKLENVYTIILMPIILFSVLGLILIAVFYFFLKRLVTGMTGCHPCYQMSSLLPVIFAQYLKPPNTLLSHSFTSVKVGACMYILQKIKIHILQYLKIYLILCD